jgi:hypothetical protein
MVGLILQRTRSTWLPSNFHDRTYGTVRLATRLIPYVTLGLSEIIWLLKRRGMVGHFANGQFRANSVCILTSLGEVESTEVRHLEIGKIKKNCWVGQLGEGDTPPHTSCPRRRGHLDS